MKKCIDCAHHEAGDICVLSFVYDNQTNYVTGETHRELTSYNTCNTMRCMWLVFGGCGKRGWRFKQKDPGYD